VRNSCRGWNSGLFRGRCHDRSSAASFGLFLIDQIRVERLGGIVTNRFHDPEAFGSPFAEQEPIAGSQIFRPLYETKGHRCPIAGSNVGPVNVNDGAGLRHGSNVEHGLILLLDGGRVAQDKDYVKVSVLSV
jgi:hypothetical protein